MARFSSLGGNTAATVIATVIMGSRFGA